MSILERRHTDLERKARKLAKNINDNCDRFGADTVYDQSVDIYREIDLYCYISIEDLTQCTTKNAQREVLEYIRSFCDHEIAESGSGDYAIYDEVL